MTIFKRERTCLFSLCYLQKGFVMKKILLASIILVLVPTIIFVPVYALMFYTANSNVKDYTDEVIGNWEAFQYYYGTERVVCDETNNLILEITDNTIKVSGTILVNTKTTYTWKGGTALSYEVDGDVVTMYLSFDSKDNLQVKIEDASYTILLRKSEE